MKKISIYNNFLPHNKEKREVVMQKIKERNYQTGRDGDFMIVIGGDGTFLKAIQKNMKENPLYIGINTGNLGFLSEFSFEDVDRIFDILDKGDYSIQELPIYIAKVHTTRGVKKYYFINDLVVERKTSRIIHSSVNVNGNNFCDISGDGIVISTTLGSTGYAVSAGGAISYDCNDTLQLTPINPVQSKAYQSLTKSVIFKDKNKLTIRPSVKKSRLARIVLDGSEMDIDRVKRLEVVKSPYNARLLRSVKFNNTKNLREKVMDEDV